MKLGRIKEEVSPGQCLAGMEIRKKVGRPGWRERVHERVWAPTITKTSTGRGRECVGCFGSVRSGIHVHHSMPPDSTSLSREAGALAVLCPATKEQRPRKRKRFVCSHIVMTGTQAPKETPALSPARSGRLVER